MKKPGILALLALFVLAAPTAGDIGSCRQEAAELDNIKFFAEKKSIDCGKCVECGHATTLCRQACNDPFDPETAVFPEDCVPLVHDGEVCLNALRAASCSEYATYVDDAAPTVPTECNFCPLDQRPVAP
ncbi:MAG TPA: hypothetical protein VFB62_13155 [Polyangiaceae bacterium]|nr:hypothetical protein [Polyangiaceae bacterium]